MRSGYLRGLGSGPKPLSRKNLEIRASQVAYEQQVQDLRAELEHTRVEADEREAHIRKESEEREARICKESEEREARLLKENEEREERLKNEQKETAEALKREFDEKLKAAIAMMIVSS